MFFYDISHFIHVYISNTLSEIRMLIQSIPNIRILGLYCCIKSLSLMKVYSFLCNPTPCNAFHQYHLPPHKYLRRRLMPTHSPKRLMSWAKTRASSIFRKRTLP